MAASLHGMSTKVEEKLQNIPSHMLSRMLLIRYTYGKALHMSKIQSRE